MRNAAALVCLMISGTPASTQDSPPKGQLKFSLVKSAFPKGALRLGYDFQGDPPQAGWRVTVGKDTLLFFDINGDGQLEANNDGLGINPFGYVVPIPETLLLKTGQYRVAFDGVKCLLLTPEDLAPVQKLASDAALVTELRVRGGLKPLVLDLKACAAAEKHLDYLKLNGLADGSGNMTSHEEQQGRPGYTPEGAVAGRDSDIEFGSANLLTGIQNNYECAWHGSPIMYPRLFRFGVALKHGMTLFYFSQRDWKLERIYMHPPDGAVGLPRAFGQGGELPNPVPGTKNGSGCGFPVFIHLVPPYRELVSAQVTDASGRPVTGTFSSPAKPANPAEWPKNSGIAVFIPTKPLLANTGYRVEFKFADPKEPVKWTFTTGN